MKLAFKNVVLSGIVLCSFSPIAHASLQQSGFYLGTSFGVSQLFGKRTDSITDGINTLTIFDNKRMSDTSLEASIFAGYRYSLPQTNWVFALEGSFGYGPYEHTVYRDLAPGFNGNQVATFKRDIGYGIAARGGYVVHQRVMPYLLVGSRIDRFSMTSIAPDASSAHQRKFLVGTDLGGGIETCFAGIKTALEFKYTYYHRQKDFGTEPNTGNRALISARPQSASVSLRFVYVF